MVGAHNMRKAEIQERAATLAEQAFNDIIAHRMLSTPKWIMYNEDEGMFNQSVTETIKYLHMTDQEHKIEQVIGSVFVIDPIAIGSTNFKEDVVK
jgi:DNA-directed RNA polymerase specialized sigma54-like protein